MKRLTIEIAKSLASLQQKLSEAKRVDSFFQSLGYFFPFSQVQGKSDEIITATNPLFEQINKLIDIIKKVDTDTEDDNFEALVELLFYIKDTVDEFKKFNESIKGTIKEIKEQVINNPLYTEAFNELWENDGADFQKEFTRRLFDYLLFTRVSIKERRLHAALLLGGVVQEVYSVSEEKKNILEKRVKIKKIWWERLPKIITAPKDYFDDTYQWSSSFDYARFLKNIYENIMANGTPGGYYNLTSETKTVFGILPESKDKEIRFPIYFEGDYNGDSFSSIDLNFLGIPANENRENPGIGLIFSGMLEDKVKATIRNKELEFQAGIAIPHGLGLIITPPFNTDFFFNVFNPEDQRINGDVELLLSLTEKEPKEKVIFGVKGGTKLSYKKIDVEAFATYKGNSPEYGIEGDLSDLKLLVKTPTDAIFLQKILGNDLLDLAIDFGAGVSSLDGFFFKGSAGTEFTIAVHKKIGPVKIETLSLGLLTTIESEEIALSFEAVATFEASLGPILFGSELGLESSLRYYPIAEGSPSWPFATDSPSFKLPNVFKALLDVAMIKGGGYLEKKDDSYAGILHLLLGTIEITAIGIINTRMPDGSKGFSMLVSISTLFIPPIQLSFGFTLSGVGGLVGINRTLQTEVLKSRIRDGAVNAIMFPENPIENAPQIISNLQAVFPPEEGRFVVAPFIRLGYGTPNIIYADMGVIIEFPFTGRIILIGSVGTQLPTPEDPIVKINVDIVGDLNFAGQYIEILGSLRDSSIAEYPLKGDFAFLLGWGARSAFLLSIGGFHPDYNPPSGFPVLNRLQVDFSQGPDVKIYGAFYQAITSNSYQIGADVEVYIKKDPFVVDGNLDFDALLIFRPNFSFKININLVVNIKWGSKRLAGAKVNFNFSGPEPFNANGYAKVEFLDGWVSKEVDFNVTWGPRRVVSYVPVNLDEEFEERLNENASWGAVLPDPSDLGVSLYHEDNNGLRTQNQAEENTQPILVHPAGTLEFRQNLLPLRKIIEVMGHSPVVEARSFAFSRVVIGQAEIDSQHLQPVMGEFARSHFENMPNEEKLSTPDFESFETGIQFGSQEFRHYGEPIPSLVNEYEEIIINAEAIAQSREVSKQPSKSAVKFKKVAATTGGLRKPTDRLRKNNASPVPNFAFPKSFVITDKTTISPLEDGEYSTYAGAKSALQTIVGEEENTLIITNTVELALA